MGAQMKRINMHDAKTNLSKVLAGIEAGEGDVFLCRAGTPVARMSAVSASGGPLRPGLLKGQIWLADDFEETGVTESALFGIKAPA